MKILKKHINHLKHISIFILVGFVLLFLSLVIGNIYYDKIKPVDSQIKLGVSFSPKYATDLGLDWKQTYLDILENLNVRTFRLNSYWTEMEPQPNTFNTEELDYLIKQADEHQARVLLVVGAKQPHWPECFVPEWAKKLTLEQRRQKTLQFIEKVVNRYKDHPSIWAWQVENEPIFSYGANCDSPDRQFLKQEVSLVRKLDPIKPIVVSDSGELRFWRTPMQLSNIFGTTLYRTVYNPFFGYFYWPVPPAAYNLKSTIMRQIFAQNNDKTIIVELQAEPWLPNSVQNTPILEQLQVFTINDFNNNVDFAKRTGFDEIYLWGIEWWYMMAKNNHPQYLDYAKQLFNTSE